MKTVLLSAMLIFTLSISAQTKNTTKDYISKWKATAVAQMNTYKIPASITLAQGILESGNGNSKLARLANNHFGIKCHSTWEGATYVQDDDKKDECFRAYDNASQSFEDHSLFLKKRRYAPLFELKMKDYKKWAKGLKSAGYATNPKYPSLLISLVERFELWRFDAMLGETIEEGEEDIAVTAPQNSTPNQTTSDDSVIEYDFNSHVNHTSKNEVKYIVAKKGVTFYKLSKELELTLRQLYKYNESKNKDVLKIGDIVYITPKRWKSRKNNPIHVCKDVTTLREVAHIEGIKLKQLLKRNDSEKPDEKLPKGTKVSLR
jgi:LysM repeat protein